MTTFAALGTTLRETLTTMAPRLRAVEPESTAARPSPARWSRREILGHLIDSAGNNHQRFVRAHLHGPLTFPGYEQEGWARVQAYNDAGWEELVDLWLAFNLHLARIIGVMPESARQTPCTIGASDPVTLAWLVEDYINHLCHHLRQLVPAAKGEAGWGRA